MSKTDREKWNSRYEEQDATLDAPSDFLLSIADLLPASGRALDVAGGAGRHALFLARRGLHVTLVDISEVALAQVRRIAEDQALSLQTIAADLETDPFPAGSWDLIFCSFYLQRSLFTAFRETLAPAGLLTVVHPTRSNLQRNARPPERFLLEDGELPRLIGDLQIVSYSEGWSKEGRHEARLVAKKSGAT